jgi:hypothetical protein
MIIRRWLSAISYQLRSPFPPDSTKRTKYQTVVLGRFKLILDYVKFCREEGNVSGAGILGRRQRDLVLANKREVSLVYLMTKKAEVLSLEESFDVLIDLVA